MHPDTCPAHIPLAESLKRMEGKLDQVLSRLGEGDTEIAVQAVKQDSLKEDVDWLKKVVYAVATVVILAVLGAVLKSVVH